MSLVHAVDVVHLEVWLCLWGLQCVLGECGVVVRLCVPGYSMYGGVVAVDATCSGV